MTDGEKIEKLEKALTLLLKTDDPKQLGEMIGRETFGSIPMIMPPNTQRIRALTLFRDVLLDHGQRTTEQEIVDKYKNDAMFNHLARVFTHALENTSLTAYDLHEAVMAAVLRGHDAWLREHEAELNRDQLYLKYLVFRTDDSSLPGGKHEHCEYFVLDWEHDPFTIPLMTLYATLCEKEYPGVAADLRAKIQQRIHSVEERWDEEIQRDIARQYQEDAARSERDNALREEIYGTPENPK